MQIGSGCKVHLRADDLAGVQAQGVVQTYNAAAVGAPGFTMNSGGSYFGQWFSNGASSLWGLGYGTSQSVTGTAVLSWDSASHLYSHQTTAPLINTCGTGPSVAAGSDAAGDVTIGSSASGACSVNFATAYAVIPHCFCSDRTRSVPCIAQATVATVVLNGTTTSGFGNYDVLDYVCIGSN